MTRISNWHWVVVMPLAALAHLGIAAAVLSSPTPPGAAAMGVGGIEMSLGAAGGAPGSAASEPPSEDAPEVPDAAETAALPPESATEQAAPTEAPVAPPETMAQAVIPVADPTPPVDAAAPEQVAAMSVPVIAPPPRPKRKPLPVETVVAKPVVAKPVVAKPVEVAPARETPAVEQLAPVKTVARLQPASGPVDIAEQVAARPPATAGADGRSGTRDTPDAGDGVGSASAAGGAAGRAADYMAHLQVWLQEHKEYPRRARRRRQEGMALLAFVMDRNGHVLEHSIRQSSGHTLLDDEVRALIRRAEPLPPPPPEVSGERIRLVVPVQFFLR